MNEDKIVSRLRKLIRLAESPDENEAATALKQAAALAAKYHLDLASIDSEQDEGAQMGQRASDVVLWGRRRRKYRWQLAHVVARAWGCAPWTMGRLTVKLSRMPSETEVLEAYDHWLELDSPPTWKLRETSSGAELVLERVFGNLPDEDSGYRWTDRSLVVGSERSTVLVMFGRKDAAEASVYVYHVLLAAVDSIAKRVASGRSHINDARWGLVFGLSKRLDELYGVADKDEQYDEPELHEASKESALVLRQAQDDARRYLEDCYGHEAYRKGRNFAAKDATSFRAGWHAAAEIDIPDPNSDRAKLGGGRALPVGDDRQLA